MKSADPDPLEPKSFWYYQQDPDAILNQTISTRDLVCWSFQIARGMDYLASKKVRLVFHIIIVINKI